MSKRTVWCLLNVVICVALTLPALGHGPSLVFTDVTDVAGVALPGTLTESVAWGDYDADGDPDLYLTNNGVNRLFRNEGNDIFVDVTVTAGVGAPGFSVGAAFGDLDNDGDLDLYVVEFGAGPDQLYRNDGPIGVGGEHVFTDVAVSAGTIIERSSRGVAMLDFDQNGLLDIYVMSIGANMLYQNQGDLQFVDVASVLSVEATATGVGVVCSDVDGNGWIDVFTGNRSGDPNRLFMNQNGGFLDITIGAGITSVGLGMGVLSFDYDNDLDMDLYWTTWPDKGLVANALYQNIDGSSFVNRASESGTEDVPGWGISCNAGDIDNDGWQDFFVTNGFSDTSTPSVLFHNQQDGTFDDVTSVLGGMPLDGRGVAFADYDGDGDLDLLVTGGPKDDTKLWRNDSVTSHHWTRIELLGRKSNWSAIGARIEVTAGGVTTVQEVSGGAGRGSFNDPPVEFGLGTAETIEQVLVRWPNRYVQIMTDVSIDSVMTIVELDIAGGPDISTEDLLFLLSEWGQTNSPADVNNDGIVSTADLLLVLMNWS